MRRVLRWLLPASKLAKSRLAQKTFYMCYVQLSIWYCSSIDRWVAVMTVKLEEAFMIGDESGQGNFLIMLASDSDGFSIGPPISPMSPLLYVHSRS